MKFYCQVDIDLPIQKVSELFSNPENLKEWQDGFISREHISGEEGQIGAKTKLVYKTGTGKVELMETIRVNDLPEEFTALYEAKQMVNIMKNIFVQIEENTTRWTAEIEYLSFHGFIPKLMAKLTPGLFKRQTQKWLDQFKSFAEKTT